mgnify:CR=1 FL=1
MNGPLDSHFNLGRYWDQADGISHAVAYVLLVMSLVSWFVILSKAFSLWRVRRVLQRKPGFEPPHLFGDFMRHSSLVTSRIAVNPAVADAK